MRFWKHLFVLLLVLLVSGIGLIQAPGGSPALAQDESQALPENPDFQGVATPNGTIPGNPKIQLVKVAGGLADPINVASANDGSGRSFVVERIGRIRIVDKGGNFLPVHSSIFRRWSRRIFWSRACSVWLSRRTTRPMASSTS